MYSPRLLTVLILLASPACRVTDLVLWAPPGPPADACDVVHVRDVVYSDEATAGDRRRLDLFLPCGRQGYPVVVFVHGGAWMMGDNRCCGLYSAVGEFLARHGIGAVLPNYRLSPAVKHPEHIRDVARAVAWTREHIAERGGRADRLFLAGHSAGAHLAALLATDQQYLTAEGMRTGDIRGVIAISGVYHLPAGGVDITLGGGPNGLRADQLMPLRGRAWPGAEWRAALPGLPVKLDPAGPVFGTNPEVRRLASPLTHVRPGLPPFLICHADHDLPTFASMAKNFHASLRKQECDATLLEVPDRNHHTIIFRAIQADDPVGRAMLDFIDRNLRSEHVMAETPN